jgi:hypothetical protein
VTREEGQRVQVEDLELLDREVGKMADERANGDTEEAGGGDDAADEKPDALE